MSKKSETISIGECRVSFLCKVCGVLFKCVSTYCTHKVENHHSLEFLHNKSLVFEEYDSTFEPNDNEQGPGFVNNAAENKWQTIQLNDLVTAKVKQEPPASPVVFSSHNDTAESTPNSTIINHVNISLLQSDDDSEPGEPTHNSYVKTEWVEDTLVIYETPSQNEDPLRYPISGNNLQENEDHKKINCYNETETESSFISSDADVDADINPSQRQVDKGDDGHDPIEDFDMTLSSQSTSTLTTSEMEDAYFNENSSDSDYDVICLDDSQPSTTTKIVFSKGPTTTKTATSASNSFISSQFKLQCTICSKQFTSKSQLGIHVSICKLYDRKIKEAGAAGPPQPQAVRSRIRNRSQNRSRNRSHGRVNTKGRISQRNNYVDCKECFIKVRRSNLKAHLETEHKIFVEDTDRKYVCQSCGSAFSVKSKLNRHARVHSDERPFVCSFPLCFSAFKNKKILQNHVQSHLPQII